ncbi:MAG: SinI family restriction endonuclease [Flavobacterium sp.]|jgi:hypothetical protein|nr:SinI family restriction endonuclease [Flavobacterium sp.]|tara:strand:- start:44 stop:694 length:651 start_codon:yes stop_codon:yes gene_type:complete
MTLDEELEIILEFAENKPNSLVRSNKTLLSYSDNEKKKYSYASTEHETVLKKKLIKGRKKIFKKPKTFPDLAVYEFLKENKDYSDEIIQNVIQYHYDAMGAENILGHFLEEFINENKEDDSWIWCSGSVVDKIDFIQKVENENEETSWRALQIKASSNTENSSSSEVRENTEILFWCRRNATKKNSQNWGKLQEFISNENLNEENFLEFLREKAKN